MRVFTHRTLQFQGVALQDADEGGQLLGEAGDLGGLVEVHSALGHDLRLHTPPALGCDPEIILLLGLQVEDIKLGDGTPANL